MLHATGQFWSFLNIKSSFFLLLSHGQYRETFSLPSLERLRHGQIPFCLRQDGVDFCQTLNGFLDLLGQFVDFCRILVDGDVECASFPDLCSRFSSLSDF